MENGRKQNIDVRDSKFGKGVFATQNISKGSSILHVKGRESTFTDSLAPPEQESYFLQIGIDKYIILDEPFKYCNHSCNPNAAINEKLELFALREIAKNEEVVWDYSSSMLERHWTMRCRCGSRYCRQLITDFDLLPEHVQEYYLHRRIVLPFIVDYLKTPGSCCCINAR